VALCLILMCGTAQGGTETLCGDCIFRVEDDGLLARIGGECGPLCVEVRLDSRGITGFDEGVFENLPHLMFLWLHANKLNAIPAGVFAPLADSLIELTLYSNMLTTMPQLEGMSALETLYLHQNVIAEFPQDALAGLTSLASLKLHQNMLTSVPPLISLTGLRDLTLFSNAIPCYPKLPPQLESFEGDPGVEECEATLASSSGDAGHDGSLDSEDGGRDSGRELAANGEAQKSAEGAGEGSQEDAHCKAGEKERERVEQNTPPRRSAGGEDAEAGACSAGQVCTKTHSEAREQQPIITITFSS